jgi:hypothetical protein
MEERGEKIERNQLQANQRIDTLMNIFESRELLKKGIFFNNQIFDAYAFKRNAFPKECNYVGA